MEYERHEFAQPLFGGVNVLRIGDTMVDTGHVAPVSSDAVREALDGPLAGVERVLHTHPHVDHVGGSQTVDAIADLPHVVPAGQPALLSDYAGYLERARAEMTRLLAGFGPDESTWDVYFPVRDDYTEERIEVIRVLEDGDEITLGDQELAVVSTPGHADPHLAFRHEASGTVLSGDLVDTDGRFQYGPLLADVGAYKESLRRIRDLDPDVLVPMHGPAMTDPGARIEESLDHVAATETRILRYVSDHGPCYAREFVADDLGVAAARAPFLTLVTYEYLRHLADRREVAVDVTDDGIRTARSEIE